jgi:glycosyltransferase involved in cell wall biosynthesis
MLADKHMSKRANAIVAISYHLKDKFEKYTAHKVPVYIIPTIINAEKWYMDAEPENNIPTLLYYGGFFGFDDIEKMIDAVGILKDKGVIVRLQLIGYNRKKPEYMESLVKRLKTQGLTSEVEMLGFVKHDQLRDYIKNSNILIGLRTDDEWSSSGLSTKLSEYLSTGRAVICSAIGDNVRYLENGKSAVMMRPGTTAQDLANEIERLVTDGERRRKIGEGGRQVALNNFEKNVVKEHINKMFNDIL